MPRNTYHSRRCIDHENIYQLAFYGEVQRIVDAVRDAKAPSDAAALLNKRGGVSTLSDAEGGGFGYFLRREKGKWQLRSVQGITPAKYMNFSVSPLHFACASTHLETIILLLQQGCSDFEANIYCSRSLRAEDMLGSDPNLKAAFKFWSSGSPQWDSDTHALFPQQFRRVVRSLVAANARCQQRLCDDLLLQVASFVPSSVVLLHQWWS